MKKNEKENIKRMMREIKSLEKYKRLVGGIGFTIQIPLLITLNNLASR